MAGAHSAEARRACARPARRSVRSASASEGGSPLRLAAPPRRRLMPTRPSTENSKMKAFLLLRVEISSFFHNEPAVTPIICDALVCNAELCLRGCLGGIRCLLRSLLLPSVLCVEPGWVFLRCFVLRCFVLFYDVALCFTLFSLRCFNLL